MLNPTHLKALTEVLATGSISAAALRLGYTPPAVSQQIAALERASGLTLFERDGRSLHPTKAAVTLGHRARDVLGSLDALEQEVSVLRSDQQGVVRVGSFPTASASFLPAALASLRRKRPRLSILVDEGEPDEILPLLCSGRLDLAIAYEYASAPRSWPRGLRVVHLIEESLFLLVTSTTRVPAGQHATLGDFRDSRWIATRAGTGGEQSLLDVCARAGFTPRIGYRSNDYGVVRGLVGAGLGVALVPALAVVQDSRIRALPLREDGPKRDVVAVSRTTSWNTLIDPVLESLAETARLSALAGWPLGQTSNNHVRQSLPRPSSASTFLPPATPATYRRATSAKKSEGDPGGSGVPGCGSRGVDRPEPGAVGVR